ncbi:MAG: HAD family hydrolase [Lachnospiraceae bacterium]|nr:HAD family hydrolase [Lachnospiraceae bacterium]
MKRLLLFDLDGTLLRTDKTISRVTLEAIMQCREKGFLIGISTARSEGNSEKALQEVKPDLIIASGGAIVRFQGQIVYEAGFTEEETRKIIDTALFIGEQEREIATDTVDAHYWNYKVVPSEMDASWGETIYTDYQDFNGAALKICVEIPEDCPQSQYAEEIAASVADCHWVRFSDGDWHKFGKAQATKEMALAQSAESLGLALENIVAFGDDYADIGMLRMCGRGIAMGNAIEAVKEIADEVIDSNDNDGIAKWIRLNILQG